MFIFICGFSAKVTCSFLPDKKDWRYYQNQTLSESEKDLFYQSTDDVNRGGSCFTGRSLAIKRIVPLIGPLIFKAHNFMMLTFLFLNFV